MEPRSSASVCLSLDYTEIVSLMSYFIRNSLKNIQILMTVVATVHYVPLRLRGSVKVVDYTL